MPHPLESLIHALEPFIILAVVFMVLWICKPKERAEERAHQVLYIRQTRQWGMFKCQNCGNKWTSHNSWANMSQKCTSCHNDVNPEDLRPLNASDRTEGPTNTKPHRRELCEMCKRLGGYCGGARQRIIPVNAPRIRRDW